MRPNSKEFLEGLLIFLAHIITASLIVIWGLLLYAYIDEIIERPYATNPNLKQIFMGLRMSDLIIASLPFGFFIFSAIIPPYFLFHRRHTQGALSISFSLTVLIIFLIKLVDALVHDT